MVNRGYMVVRISACPRVEGYKVRQTEWLKRDPSLTSWVYTDDEEEGVVFSQYHEALDAISRVADVYLVVVPVAPIREEIAKVDIRDILGLGVGKRMVVRHPNREFPNEYHSMYIVEGLSYDNNCIYARCTHGWAIGTSMTGVPGSNAVCIKESDLQGYKVEVEE